jgi:hypothetical protein
MQATRLLVPFALALLGNTALAQQAPVSQGVPFSSLETQIGILEARIDALEDAAPNPNVDGRTYCMILNISGLRGRPSIQTKAVDAIISRRVLTFEDGAFAATLVASQIVSLADDGTVTSSVNDASPPLLAGTFSQTGNQVDVVFPDGAVEQYYVSRDGSVIHTNSVLLLGPFPSTFALGLTRSVTMIESDTCDAFGT